MMSLIAALIAALGSELVVGALMVYGFDLEPNLHLTLWITLPIATFFTLALVVNSLIKGLLTPINKAVS
jgi:putative ABC transport system permease protein